MTVSLPRQSERQDERQADVTADVVIVGAGFAGLGMAIALDKAGRGDYIILEKAGDVGGTWRENTYPGCACDIRSLLYSFSFEPKHDWSRQFPRQPITATRLPVRSTPWVLPKPDRPFTDREHWLFRRVPGLQRLYRWRIYWQNEQTIMAFIWPRRLAGAGERMARAFIARQIEDPGLRAKVTPSYRIGCKRVLLANDYYPALAQPHVDLVTEAVTGITENGVIAAGGSEYQADVIIYGTGFHVTDAFAHADITGARGLRIADAWRDGAEAYLGLAVAGFPNLFVFVGPNTGLGHNSMIFMIESQIRYVRKCMDLIDKRGALAVSDRAQRDFNAGLQRDLTGTVWTSGGCRSWYLDPSGVNRALWPGSTVSYWWRTRKLAERDFEPAIAPGAGAGPAGATAADGIAATSLTTR